jgi:hypothetical protein
MRKTELEVARALAVYMNSRQATNELCSSSNHQARPNSAVHILVTPTATRGQYIHSTSSGLGTADCNRGGRSLFCYIETYLPYVVDLLPF